VSPLPVKTDRGTRLVDLTLELEHGMPTHSFFPAPIVLPYLTHEQCAEKGLGTRDDPWTFAVNYVAMLEHVGTHVDAPLHLAPRRAAVDEMPLDWFTGKAVCLDLRHIPDLGEIDVPDLEQAEREADVKVDGHIVLLCSGFHARHWPRPTVATSNPGLTAAATHWLAGRGSRAHGVEGPSTDRAGATDFPSHRVCRDRSLVHYEWLVNLEELLGRGEFTFHGFPLKWKGGTGSPVRAVAELA
jgi:kynurenine formamidase